MRKREKKLELHRETVLRLDARPLGHADLIKARGGDEWTGCMSECTECGTRGGFQMDQIG